MRKAYVFAATMTSLVLLLLTISKRLTPKMAPMKVAKGEDLPSLLALVLIYLFGYKAKPTKQITTGGQSLSVWAGEVQTKDWFSAFGTICGSGKSALVFVFPHCLAQRCFLTLLGHANFSASLIGSVHLKSLFSVPDPEKLCGVLQDGQPVSISAEHSASSPVKKGTQFYITMKLSRGGEVLWTEVIVLFKAGRGNTTTEGLQGIDDILTDEGKSQFMNIAEASATTSETFTVSGAETWNYGTTFGDVNPIHMNSFLAKVLGQRGRIIHGMHAVARCLSTLEKSQIDSSSGSGAPSSVLPSKRWAVSFKAPVPCGKAMRAKILPTSSGLSFDIYGGSSDRPSFCVRPVKHPSQL